MSARGAEETLLWHEVLTTAAVIRNHKLCMMQASDGIEFSVSYRAQTMKLAGVHDAAVSPLHEGCTEMPANQSARASCSPIRKTSASSTLRMMIYAQSIGQFKRKILRDEAMAKLLHLQLS